MTASQNGWTAGATSAINKTAVAVGTNLAFPGGVRRDAPGQLLMEVAGRFHREVEPLVSGWCWGYAYRAIRGATTTSNHASGTAIDVNAPRHALGKAGTFTPEQVASIRRILALTGGVVRWGGDYSGRKDEMHFEIDDGRSMADCERALAALRTPAHPAPTSGGTVLRLGSSGPGVRALQHVLNAWYPFLHLTEDGAFGPDTESGVREFQRRAQLAVDGIAGPAVLGALHLD